MRVFLGVIASMFLSAVALADDRPNIVIIFTDDHAYQAISAYGDSRKLVETPNIDRIAKEGVRFDRCLVPNSICGPSRACLLTGKYNHLNGFYNNTNSRFDSSQQTFPKLLKAAGYQTAVIGKWHLISEPTGFDEWQILPGQGIYYNPPMNHKGQRVQHQGYTTDIITDLSIDWMKKRDTSKPFLLMCQHKAPHREWSPPLRHLGHDNDRVYPEPETLFDDYSGRGKAERSQDMTFAKTFTDSDAKLVPPPGISPEQKKEWDKYYGPRNAKFLKDNPQGKDLVRWRYNRFLHDYLGCIKAVDDSVGQVLKYLDDNKLADNTLVIYASDQGFYLGEHGWFDKRWIFEESLRTPLLVRWPRVGKAGHTTKEIVSIIDLAPLCLDAAQIQVPDDMQGVGIVPQIRGLTPAKWRKSFYYHYYEHPAVHSVARHYGVVTDRYKLVRFYEPEFDEWELFDLEKDPHELKSVYGKPEYADVQKDLEKELARLRKELKVPENDPPETILGKKNPPAKTKK